ncbi:hypothetical protein I6I10_09595 [Corynebacterium glucuronolyticum]|uniref:Prolipoprotein LppL n=1 Tax=Corynebacterium glucuronolyticum TaxID=39791 RepID=A0A7T4JUC9_9CORY|nr:hypothetical protein [Corynebacterium glucuronolyticum]MCT1442708.1 hypothetical protein [Corynebacterium glucuronolyticum]MCT1562656.1 hypothetical protein [Corynebacterium glucuronolyticum]QQB45738.1 hypothetical protein I6I10_09595 [Corynebacterium glucuronolyticum]
MNIRSRKLISACGLLTALSIGLTSCGAADEQESMKTTEEQTDYINNPVGNATPQQSPASNKPDGTVFQVDEKFPEITDIEAAGDILAVRTGPFLHVGTVDALEKNEGTTLQISAKCGDLTVTDKTFVIACPVARDGGNSGEIFLIDAEKPALDNVRSALQPFVAAAVTTDGTVIGGSPEADAVTIFKPGESTSNTEVNTGGPVHQIIALPRTGETDLPDAVVASDMSQTRVTGVDLVKDRTGGSLRAGVGVSRIAPAENTTMLVADNIGDSLRIYNNLDVIRLHQSVPIGPHPWAVAWDNHSDTAWVTTLGDNKVTSYSLATGKPIEKDAKNTVADAQALAVLDNGTLVIGSASGEGLQIIPAK